jgi:hypothetical protein
LRPERAKYFSLGQSEATPMVKDNHPTHKPRRGEIKIGNHEKPKTNNRKMKLLKEIIAPFIVSFLLVFAGCDIVEEPYLKDPQGNGSQTGDFEQKVLLEKFTGHRCTNCPAADQTAKNLKAAFGDRLVVVSIHAGWFSNPLGDPFHTNYQTPIGTQMYQYHGIDALPEGLVNRLEFSGSRLLGHGSWGAAITQTLNQEPSAGLTLTVNFNSDTRLLELAIKTDVLKQISGQAMISAFVCESGLVSAQISGGQTIPDYVHDNVLRAHFGTGGAWGEPIFDNGATAGQVFDKTFSLTLDPNFNANNCHVVVILQHGSTKEVIQVETAKVIDN